MSTKLLPVKFADGDDAVLRILAVPFGGPINGSDLDGERFTKDTDLCLKWFPDTRPLLYDHGHDKSVQLEPVGYFKASSVELVEDEGYWIEAQLDKSSRYFDAIQKIVREGKMFASSGSIGHLVKKSKTGNIEIWPWVEESLTVTPANFAARTEPVEVAKHYKSAGLDIGITPEAPAEINATILADMEEILDQADAILEEGKAKLSTDSRNKLADDSFAYVDSKGVRHLPVNDEAHAKNALARFEQTNFETPAKKKSAARKIRAACRKFGIDVSDDSAVAKAAKYLDDIVSMLSEDPEMAEAFKTLAEGSMSSGGALVPEEVGGKPVEKAKADEDKTKEEKTVDIAKVIKAVLDDPKAAQALLEAKGSAEPVPVAESKYGKVLAMAKGDDVMLFVPGVKTVDEDEVREAVKTGEVIVTSSSYWSDAPEGSVEDWLQDLRRELNKNLVFGGPFGSAGYVEILSTWCYNGPGNAFVCVHSWGDDESEDSYYNVEIEEVDGEPVITESQAYLMVLMPKVDVPATAIGNDEDDAGKSIEVFAIQGRYSVKVFDAFRQRAEALHERRVKSGRRISSANEQVIIGVLDAYDAMKTRVDELRALLDGKDDPEAKAEGDDTLLRLQAETELLEIEEFLKERS